MSQVLDAMFEKTVSTEEHIIDQDDDGDNFYVIERWDQMSSVSWAIYNYMDLVLNWIIALFIQRDFWNPC